MVHLNPDSYDQGVSWLPPTDKTGKTSIPFMTQIPKCSAFASKSYHSATNSILLLCTLSVSYEAISESLKLWNNVSSP